MAKIAFHLPGNRGVLSGPEGTVIGNEMRRQQAKELPKEGQLWVSNLSCNFSSLTAVTPTAGTCYLYPMEPLLYKIRIAYARLSVAVDAAGSTAEMALYRLQSPSEMGFREVAGTRAAFDCSTTGVKTTTLPAEVPLLPGARYFFGFRCATALTSFMGVDNTNTALLARLEQLGGLLPFMSGLTKSDTAPTIALAYLTEFGNQVL